DRPAQVLLKGRVDVGGAGRDQPATLGETEGVPAHLPVDEVAVLATQEPAPGGAEGVGHPLWVTAADSPGQGEDGVDILPTIERTQLRQGRLPRRLLRNGAERSGGQVVRMRPGRRAPEHAYSCNTHARSAEGPGAGGPHGRSRSGDSSSTAS